MKQIFLVIALTCALVLPRGTTAQSGDAGAIQGVISSQFDAFLAEDVETAFSFASPMIQGMFRTPSNFGMMVENGYPMVWAPASTEFLELDERNGALWQKVLVQDTGGTFHVLEYKMVQRDGDWLIDGVQLIEEAGIGV
jgi:hypothetical protein